MLLRRTSTRTSLPAVRSAMHSVRFASDVAEKSTKLMAPVNGEGNEGKTYGYFLKKPCGYYYGPGAYNYGRVHVTSNFVAQYFSAFPDSFTQWYHERHWYGRIFMHTAIMMPFLIYCIYQDEKRRAIAKEARERGI